MIRNIIDAIAGEDGGNSTIKKSENGQCKKIEGTVVLMKKNVLDFNDFHASVLDRVHELFGQRVSLQLVSAVNYGYSTGLFLSSSFSFSTASSFSSSSALFFRI